jgi:SGNH hydrolase-like domain, acetyltransferase AlgX
VTPRGLLAHLALLLAALVVSFLLAEAGVRLLTPYSPSLLVADPVVGKRFLPGFAARIHVPECGCEVDVRFDREGLRGPDRPYAKPPGVKRVAVVGDSMVAAVATAEEKTLAGRLERLLAASRPAAKWEVMNAGVSSSSTGSELALYRAVLERYASDVLVLVFWVGNDLADNSFELTRAPRLYFDLDASGRLVKLPFAFEPSPIAGWLDRWSRFYVWQKAAFRQLRGSVHAATRGLEPVDLVFAEPEPEPVAHAWAITAALLRAFREETAARGTALVLVAAPSAVQVYDDLWSELEGRAGLEDTRISREHPEARLAGIAGHEGIPFLALLPAFRGAAPGRASTRPREQLYYEGRFHWNDAGNALAARTVHELLLTVVESGP